MSRRHTEDTDERFIDATRATFQELSELTKKAIAQRNAAMQQCTALQSKLDRLTASHREPTASGIDYRDAFTKAASAFDIAAEQCDTAIKKITHLTESNNTLRAENAALRAENARLQALTNQSPDRAMPTTQHASTGSTHLPHRDFDGTKLLLAASATSLTKEPNQTSCLQKLWSIMSCSCCRRQRTATTTVHQDRLYRAVPTGHSPASQAASTASTYRR